MNSKPQTLLDALCIAAGVQGGTIHQYDLSNIVWECVTPPNSRRNTEGLYDLVYTDKDGARWCLGFTGGPSIAAVRKYQPINAAMKMRFDVEPCCQAAYEKHEARQLVNH